MNDKKQKEEIKKLKEEINLLKQQVEENKNKYLRALADYQNLEKRVEEEKFGLIKTANKDLILKLLSFLDILGKAEVFNKDLGLVLAKNKLYQTLKEVGVEEIEVINKQFDPILAEAVDVVTDIEDNKVVEVLRKGYMFEDKIIRVAQVKVSKKV